MQVHDELVLEAPEAELARVKAGSGADERRGEAQIPACRGCRIGTEWEKAH